MCLFLLWQPSVDEKDTEDPSEGAAKSKKKRKKKKKTEEEAASEAQARKSVRVTFYSNSHILFIFTSNEVSPFSLSHCHFHIFDNRWKALHSWSMQCPNPKSFLRWLPKSRIPAYPHLRVGLSSSYTVITPEKKIHTESKCITLAVQEVLLIMFMHAFYFSINFYVTQAVFVSNTFKQRVKKNKNFSFYFVIYFQSLSRLWSLQSPPRRKKLEGKREITSQVQTSICK